jgi:hypothetical protein
MSKGTFDTLSEVFATVMERSAVKDRAAPLGFSFTPARAAEITTAIRGEARCPGFRVRKIDHPPNSTASEEVNAAKRARTRIAASWSSAVAEAQQSSSTVQT